MPLKISDFSSHIAKTGLASPNKFQVEFAALPDNVLGNFTLKDLNLMCESITIAGRTVQSILNREYGVNREVAYNGPTYQPVTMAFLCSEDWAAKKIFDKWNNMIVDISKGYDVAYYSKYATGQMTVSALDKTNTSKKYSITYRECFPKSVAAIDMNHSTQNTTLRVTVEMSYAYWETEDIKMGNSAGPQPYENAAFGDLSGVN